MNNYKIVKNKKKEVVVSLDYDKMNGYQLKPRVNKNDTISVSKIKIIKPEFSEKIIRKKIDKKIMDLLSKLQMMYDDSEDGGESAINKSLMEAEVLRQQIINNYIKYLGNTYSGLTLEKLRIIVDQFRYKLFMIEASKQNYYYNDEQKETHKSR